MLFGAMAGAIPVEPCEPMDDGAEPEVPPFCPREPTALERLLIPNVGAA